MYPRNLHLQQMLLLVWKRKIKKLQKAFIGRSLKSVTGVLTFAELQSLLSVAAERFPEFYLLILFMADVGARLGEAIALRWTDVDLGQRSARLARSFSGGSLGPTKTRRQRTVELSTRLRDVLRQRAPDLFPDDALVFPNTAGGFIDSSNFRERVWKPLVRPEYPFGTDHYLATGEIYPDAAFEEVKQHDVIYLGAIGDPRAPVGKIEYGIIAKMRFELDLYVNLRPIKLFDARLCPLKGKGPKDIDMAIVRENTEGAYAGMYGFCHKGLALEVATQTMVYSRAGVERAIRYAFELARKRNKDNKVTLIDKANAVRAHDIWTRTFADVAKEFPDITTDHAYVDAACMWLVKNPEWFVFSTGDLSFRVIHSPVSTPRRTEQTAETVLRIPSGSNDQISSSVSGSWSSREPQTCVPSR